MSSATLQKAVSDTRAAVATVGRKLIATITPAYEALVEGWYFDNSLTFDTRPLADTIRDAALHLSPGGSTNSAWRDLKTDDGPVSALLAGGSCFIIVSNGCNGGLKRHRAHFLLMRATKAKSAA